MCVFHIIIVGHSLQTNKESDGETLLMTVLQQKRWPSNNISIIAKNFHFQKQNQAHLCRTENCIQFGHILRGHNCPNSLV